MKRIKKLIPEKKGFTLIELLVAMTIMAFLMGIALVSYQGSRRAARDSKRKADLEQIRSALEIYRTDMRQYPGNLSDLVSNYIEAVPTDPGSCQYYYKKISNNLYILCASLETGGLVVSDCGNNCGSGCTCNYKVANP